MYISMKRIKTGDDKFFKKILHYEQTEFRIVRRHTTKLNQHNSLVRELFSSQYPVIRFYLTALRKVKRILLYAVKLLEV